MGCVGPAQGQRAVRGDQQIFTACSPGLRDWARFDKTLIHLGGQPHRTAATRPLDARIAAELGRAQTLGWIVGEATDRRVCSPRPQRCARCAAAPRRSWSPYPRRPRRPPTWRAPLRLALCAKRWTSAWRMRQDRRSRPRTWWVWGASAGTARREDSAPRGTAHGSAEQHAATATRHPVSTPLPRPAPGRAPRRACCTGRSSTATLPCWPSAPGASRPAAAARPAAVGSSTAATAPHPRMRRQWCRTSWSASSASRRCAAAGDHRHRTPQPHVPQQQASNTPRAGGATARAVPYPCLLALHPPRPESLPTLHAPSPPLILAGSCTRP